MKTRIEILLLQKAFCETYLETLSNKPLLQENEAVQAYVTAQHALATKLLLMEEQN